MKAENFIQQLAELAAQTGDTVGRIERARRLVAQLEQEVGKAFARAFDARTKVHSTIDGILADIIVARTNGRLPASGDAAIDAAVDALRQAKWHRTGEGSGTPSPMQIQIEVGGKLYAGTYTVTGKTIRVRTAHGEKATQIGQMPAEMLARLILRELVEEGDA